MGRARFYWMLSFLLIALAVAVTYTVSRSEQELLTRVQAEIAAAQIPYYGLRMDGRDAVLAGFVTEDTDIERLTAVVAGVAGVRAVRNEVSVERGSRPRTPDAPALVATLPPELRVQHLGGLLVVTGRLPADGSLAVLEQALRARFPLAELRLEVQSDEGVGAREWTSILGAVVAALAEFDEPSGLVAHGNAVQLYGEISAIAERLELDAILSGTPSVEWRLMLTRPSGSTGGAP